MKLTNYGQFYEDLKHHEIEYALEHTVALGFDSVEFLGLSSITDTAATARLLSSYKLDVPCFSVAATLLDTAKRTRAETESLLLRCADTAAELGSPYLHHTLVSSLKMPPNAPTLEEILPSLVDSAERIARYCKSLALTCLYEPQGMYVNGNGLTRFFEEMEKRCDNIGICGDVGNALFADHAPELVFDDFADRIRHVHLKDYEIHSAPLADKQGNQSRGGAWLYETELGRGEVPIPYCLQKLREQHYDGAYSFEITGDDEALKRAIAYAKSIIAI